MNSVSMKSARTSFRCLRRKRKNESGKRIASMSAINGSSRGESVCPTSISFAAQGEESSIDANSPIERTAMFIPSAQIKPLPTSPVPPQLGIRRSNGSFCEKFNALRYLPNACRSFLKETRNKGGVLPVPSLNVCTRLEQRERGSLARNRLYTEKLFSQLILRNKNYLKNFRRSWARRRDAMVIPLR